MGIRINKKMGWIFTGSELDTEILSNITLNDLRKENPTCEELMMDLSFSKLTLSDSLESIVDDVTEDGEEDPLKRIYVFTPPIQGEKWDRHDDAIDYYEAGSMAEIKVNYLSNEIFPYSKTFVVSKTLNPLDRIMLQHARNFSSYAGKSTPELQNKLSDLGFDLTGNLRDQFHMTAPKIIELVAIKCGIPDYRVLRPGIVTFWR